MTYKIVITDDHKIVASGLEKLIDGFPNCEVLYTVHNGKDLLKKLETAKNVPDVVILDISMPVMDGYKTMSAIRQKHGELKVIGLSMNEDKHSFLKLIELGANGFVSKMSAQDELQVAIETVIEKNVYFSEQVTKALFEVIREGKSKSDRLITEKEKNLLSHIGSELTYKEIGQKLGVSEKTIDGYRNSLFKKVGVRSRTTLAIFAHANGYFSTPVRWAGLGG